MKNQYDLRTGPMNFSGSGGAKRALKLLGIVPDPVPIDDHGNDMVASVADGISYCKHGDCGVAEGVTAAV